RGSRKQEPYPPALPPLLQKYQLLRKRQQNRHDSKLDQVRVRRDVDGLLRLQPAVSGKRLIDSRGGVFNYGPPSGRPVDDLAEYPLVTGFGSFEVNPRVPRTVQETRKNQKRSPAKQSTLAPAVAEVIAHGLRKG